MQISAYFESFSCTIVFHFDQIFWLVCLVNWCVVVSFFLFSFFCDCFENYLIIFFFFNFMIIFFVFIYFFKSLFQVCPRHTKPSGSGLGTGGILFDKHIYKRTQLYLLHNEAGSYTQHIFDFIEIYLILSLYSMFLKISHLYF